MMQNKWVGWGLIPLLFISGSCSSSYKLTSISRQRVLIDSSYDVSPDSKALAFVAPYRHTVDSIMSPVVGYVGKYLTAHRPESELSDLLPDILLWAAPSFHESPDFAIYNIGGIRASLAKGAVTYGDIVEVAPFENKICFLTLKGSDVLDLFRQIAKRGGEGVCAGVNLVISKQGDLLEAKVHGQPVDPKGTYRVATLDYVAQGNDQMVAFKKGTDVLSPQEKENDIRFIIVNYFKEQMRKGKVIDPHIEGRIAVR